MSDMMFGVYVDGEQMTVHEGNIEVIQLARSEGWELSDEETVLAYVNEDEGYCTAEEAIEWLNDNRAGDGCWYWFEGSFGYWANDEDEMEWQ